MTTTACKFIGGPADGRWFDVPDDAPAWRVMERRSFHDFNREIKLPFKKHVYRREALGCGSHPAIPLFVYDRMPLHEAIKLLVRNYNPTPEPE